MRVALLITTFNRPDALEAVLETVKEQSRRPDFVVVCDDGSANYTNKVVRRWSSELPLLHVWQKDAGFRAARIRNLGVLKCNVDYLIWIDGDCLLPPWFLEYHVKLAGKSRLVAGGRYLIAEDNTIKFLKKKLSVRQIFCNWKFIRARLGILRDVNPQGWETVRSCNFGVFKNDMLLVGGFDETFTGWGYEDSDLVLRLLKIGVKVRSGRLASSVAHLYHAVDSQTGLSENKRLLEATLVSRDSGFATSSVLSNL